MMQLSLVFFTVLSQFAVGLALFAALFPMLLRAGGSTPGGAGVSLKKYYFFILFILALAMFSSVFHLGHPLGAIRALANMGSSWLSREILLFGVFGAAVLLTWLTGNRVLMWVCAIVGLLAVGATGMGYGPEAQMAIHNSLPLVFFLLTTVALGSIGYSYVAPQEKVSLLRRMGLCVLLVMFVLYAAIPSIWASGNVVMQATAKLWLASPFYWVRLIVGLVLPIVMLLKKDCKFDKAILPLVLIGELLGRVVFFETAHSARFIGEAY